LLRRAIENVVRDAISHTPEGSCVSVETRTESQSGKVRIAVADRGGGVAEHQLEAIFEPFFHGAQSSDGEGHGLGLAIAKSVVDAHGGSILASNRGNAGLLVEILLPLSPAENGVP
jgi:two-component system OmpR family sensor kinase